MKQLSLDVQTGRVAVSEVPAPLVRPGGVRVRVGYSAISVGTERMRLEFGKKSLVGKALDRPEQVRKVLETAAREGFTSTYRKVKGRLSELSPIGYSLAGTVEAVGEGVSDLQVGDRVACAGGGHANHAERVWVPRNLVAPLPDGVGMADAAFGTIGAIAMQGVRQADLRLGETAVVIGLGIVGQLTVQLLNAAGVHAIAVDIDPSRVELAGRHGAIGVVRSDDVEGRVEVETGGIGADAVIITAATSSDDPIRLAGAVARDRARVVVVGLVPMNLPRPPFYDKELELRLSRSYGPGRYDPAYEEKGQDYPVGYVRWTEGRNLGEFLRLLGTGAVELEGLITHRYPFDEAEDAYEVLSGEDGRGALGVLLEYGEPVEEPARIELKPARAAPSGRVSVGFIGAGAFATGVLIPALRDLDVELAGIMSAGGLSARSAAENHGFRYLAGSAEALFEDGGIHAVFIATRHHDHARLAATALRAGKHVFVEKPLALSEDELDDVLDAASAGPLLMVGFNRRFAPATRFLLERFAGTAGARVVHVRANAGALPPDHWAHDPEVGGGRIRGEGCHFIDLALYLAGAAPVEIRAMSLGAEDPAARLGDNVQIGMRCANGSLATVLYTGKGNMRSGKERVEVFAGGATGIIEDFRSAEFRGASGKRERWKGRQDKGHAAELRAFIRAVREGGPPPIPLEALAASSRATLDAARAVGGEGGA